MLMLVGAKGLLECFKWPLGHILTPTKPHHDHLEKKVRTPSLKVPLQEVEFKQKKCQITHLNGTALIGRHLV